MNIQPNGELKFLNIGKYGGMYTDTADFSDSGLIISDGSVLLRDKLCFAADDVNISMSAKAVFEAHNIYYEFTTLADKIMNRENTDVCPMEKTVAQIDDPEQAYCAIKQKLASLMAKK